MAEQIVDQILESARKAGEQLLREAQQKRDRRLSEGKQTIEREATDVEGRGRRLAEQDVQQQLSNARLEQHRKYLSAKRRLLDRVYRGAWEQMTEPSRYRAWLEGQLEAHAQSGDRLIVSSLEAERFQQELRELLDKHGVALSEQTGHFRAGFVIDRGTTRLNCSLDEAFAAEVGASEIEVSGILFGK